VVNLRILRLNNSNNNNTKNLTTNISYFLKSNKNNELGFSFYYNYANANSKNYQKTNNGSNNIENISEQGGGYKGFGIGISYNRVEPLKKIKFIYGINFISSITIKHHIEGYFLTIKEDVNYIFDKISFQKTLPNSIIINPNLFIGATYELKNKVELGANLNYGQYIQFINGKTSNTVVTNGLNMQQNTNYIYTNKDLEINKSTELNTSFFVSLYLRYSLAK
jgi:hypothetical protein